MRVGLFGLWPLACLGAGCVEEKTPATRDSAAFAPDLDADGDGYDEEAGDCDDADPTVSPGATEVCDGQDQDCDGVADDDASDAVDLHADADADGYGEATTTHVCPDADGYAADGTDCADDDASIHPDATEVCDGRDQDCDGLVDEDADDADAWYADADADGYGDPAALTQACDPVAGAVANGGDCDDAEPLAWSGAPEICGDGVDNDCDGVATACGLDGRYAAEDGARRIYGDQAGQEFSAAVANVGDWTGDGEPDLLVGAPDTWHGTSALVGAVFLLAGGTWSGETRADAAIASTYGATSYSGLGAAIDPLGDLDGDGLAEAVVGAYGAVNDWTGQQNGVVYVYGGHDGASLTEVARLVSMSEMSDAGWALAGTGDVTGDGVPDLAVGHYDLGWDAHTYTGGVQLVSGADIAAGGDVRIGVGYGGTVLAGPTMGMAGMSVASGDDVDGDGVNDVLVGSRGLSASAAWLVTGWPAADGLLDDDAATRVLTDETDDFEGITVALPGDMDGDGYGEIVVGAIWDGTNNAGSAYLLPGDATGDAALSDAWAVLTGETTDAHAGSSLDALGDLDGDGRMDLLVGSRGYDGQDGAAYLVRDPSPGTSSLGDVSLSWVGSTGDGVGQAVRGLGDLDDDGTPDVLVAAPYAYATHGPGEAWVWLTGTE